MTENFKERQQAFENKFAHDEELQFKAVARRNRLVGLWAAEKLGKNNEAADVYARDIVILDLEEAGDDDVVRKIMADFAAAHVPVKEPELRQKMAETLKEAVAHLKNE